MENYQTSNKSTFKSIGTIASFLSYEIIALIAFSLTNSFVLFGVLSAVLAILLVVATIKDVKKEGLSNYLLFVFPIFIFGILSALSYFNSSDYVDSYKMVTRIFMPITFATLALCGCLLAKSNGFKIKYALLAIYGALALYCLINLITTMVQYVPFYSLIYKGKYVYYNGKPSPKPISETAYALIGFEMEEVTIDFFSIFPSILFTSVIALFFIDFKKERKMFLAYAAFALIGFLSLLFTPTIMTAITDFLVLVVICLIVLKGKNKISNKFVKALVLTLSILLAAGLLFVIANAQHNFGFMHKITESNKLFDKLFNTNHITASYNAVFDDLFSFSKLFGFPPYYSETLHENVWPAGGIISDLLMTSGLFGYGFFVFIVISFAKSFKKYYLTDSTDDVKDKSLILAIVVVTLGYSLINYSAKPFIYSDMVSNFLTRNVFILLFFFFGYVYSKGLDTAQPQVATTTENNSEEVTSINA